MFDSADAASSSRSVQPISNKKLLIRETNDEDEDSPSMDDIQNAIKVIGVIRRLIGDDQLVLKPPAHQNGLVKKGTIPIEDNRKFTSRIGSHQAKKSYPLDIDDEEDEIENQDETLVSKSKAKLLKNKSKKEIPISIKLNSQVSTLLKF